MVSNHIGKKITSIRICKNKVVIYFSKEKVDVSKEMYSSLFLYKGKILDLDIINTLKNSLNEEKFLKYSLNLINKHYYSTYQIKQKLIKKGANKIIINNIVKYLKDNKLLDDKELTLNYIDSLSKEYYGKLRIKKILISKGLDCSFIDEYLTKEKEEEKCKTYYPIGVKKFLNKPDEKQRESIVRHLINKGYEIDVINKTLRELFKDNKVNNCSNLEKDFYAALKAYKSKYESPRELKKHIIDKLRRKGYKYNEIMKLMEEIEYDIY